MVKRRLWGLALISTVVTLITVACGGDPTPSSSATASPTATPAPSTESSPEATATAPSATSDAGAGSATQTVARYNWEITQVDSEGAKPSLAVDASGTPHIAFMSEDMPGFVKYAVLGSSEWQISTVDTGYFYGPLDIKVGDDGVPQIVSWDGSQWNVETVATTGSQPLGQQVSLALDPQGVLHLTFADARRKAGPGVIGNVMYGRGTPIGAASVTGDPATQTASLGKVEPDPN